MVTAAAISDLRSRRIPNWIPVSGAALGFVLQVWNGGFYGALSSLAGAGLGLGIFMALYIAGGMGAGDVKLFSAVGALVGPQALIIVFIFTGLLGGIAALALSVSRGRLRETLEKTGALALGIRTAPAADSLRLPYGAVIAAGALLSVVFSRI
jgi:prepilin peptidase CpaA